MPISIATANFLADKLETVIYEGGAFSLIQCLRTRCLLFNMGKIKNFCGIKQENDAETYPNHEDFTAYDIFH